MSQRMLVNTGIIPLFLLNLSKRVVFTGSLTAPHQLPLTNILLNDANCDMLHSDNIFILALLINHFMIGNDENPVVICVVNERCL